jgi:hypothetical protein
MLQLTPEQAAELKRVLIHCVGDTIVCRHCGRTFGLDSTQQGKDAWELYKRIFGHEPVDTSQ